MDFSSLTRHIEELESLYATLFLLIEESMDYDDMTSERLLDETNGKTENVMRLIDEKSTELKQDLKRLENCSNSDYEMIHQQVTTFSEKLSMGIKSALTRIKERTELLQDKKATLRKSLVEIKDKREKYKGYKIQTRKDPKLINSSI